MYKKIIEKLVMESDIPRYNKFQVIDLFVKYFEIYYLEGRDIYFDTPELRDFWFYVKIEILSRSVNFNNDRAYVLLSKELRLNAQKYLNPAYKVKKVGA